MTQTFKTYIPMTMNVEPYFGLAYIPPHTEDLITLRASWFYVWGYGKPLEGRPCVPMAYFGQRSSALISDYSGPLLVFNEPDNIRPFGCNMDPATAAQAYKSLLVAYPKAQHIVGGWMLSGKAWIEEFLKQLEIYEVPRPTRWHVHGYFDYNWIQPRHVPYFIGMYQEMTGGEYWITEYGSYKGDPATFTEVTQWFISQPWIKRIAPYTNRQIPGADYNGPTGLTLINEDGTPTPVGQAYLDCMDWPYV